MRPRNLPPNHQAGWGLISLILLVAVGALAYLHRDQLPGLLQQQLERYVLPPTETSEPDTLLYRQNQARIQALERQVNELDETLDRLEQDDERYSEW